jgi:hypothetical protein
VTKKVIRKKQLASASRLTWLWAGAGVLFLLVAGIVVWNQLGRRSDVPLQVTGAPRLTVDRTTIDEGDVKLGKSIRSAFRLQNVGDQPLQVLGEPQVEVVEGC